MSGASAAREAASLASSSARAITNLLFSYRLASNEPSERVIAPRPLQRLSLNSSAYLPPSGKVRAPVPLTQFPYTHRAKLCIAAKLRVSGRAMARRARMCLP